MEVPNLRPARLRDVLGLMRDHRLFDDTETGNAIYDIIYWESIAMLDHIGIDARDAEPDSFEENLLVAMIVHYNNGILAGFNYVKAPRRL